MPPPPDFSRYETAVANVRAQMVAYAAAVWASTRFTDAAVARLVELMVPKVASGQLVVANLTSAYLAQATNTKPLPVTDAVTKGRGVEPEKVYQRPIITTRTEVSKGKPVPKALEAGGQRLESLVTTDLQMAKVRQADASLQHAGRKYYRRVPKGAETCAMCLIASTQRYNGKNLMPIHPGCVPGDSPVSAGLNTGAHESAFAWRDVDAVSRRLFQGELVQLITARGDELRVTPNHPVLTDKGWLPAHLLSVGDTVFRSGERKREALGGPDVHQGPVLAQDVFDAARMAFPLVRMPLAAEDFHADGADGEVEIVYTHGRFPSERNTQLVEVVRESLLMDAHSGRLALHGASALSPLLEGVLTPGGSDVGGSGLREPFFNSHLGGTQLSGARTAPRFDAPAEEFSLKNAAVYASQGLDLERRLAGRVERDCVIEKRLIGFRDHVFNLHTREGWYSSSNHIVSNCDCGVDVIPPGMDLDLVLDESLLEATHQKVKEVTGLTDRGARAVDYRKLLIEHEHGELGPVLTWRGQKFTSLDQLKD